MRRIWLGLLLAGVALGASIPRRTLLVLSKGDHTLSVVDPTSLQVLARFPSGPDPHETIASADGRFAYISNYGGGAYHTISVVDLDAQKDLPPIDLGPLGGPHGLEFTDGKLWFTAEGAKVMGRYDPATKKIDLVIGTGQDRTHMLWISPDFQRIVTSNVASGTMTFIDKQGRGWEETLVPVGHGSEGFDVSPDGKELWAANAGDGTISIIDMAAKKVTATLSANVRSANRLKFSRDGKLVFVSMLGAPDVAVIDAASRKEVKRVPVGHGAAGLLTSPDGSLLYVSCTPDNYVAIIDLKKLEVTGHIDAGKGPDGLAWLVRQ